MTEHRRIVLDPEVLAGKPVVRGTRLSVEFIIGLMADGWNEADILTNYPGLTHDDMMAGLISPFACLRGSGYWSGELDGMVNAEPRHVILCSRPVFLCAHVAYCEEFRMPALCRRMSPRLDVAGFESLQRTKPRVGRASMSPTRPMGF